MLSRTPSALVAVVPTKCLEALTGFLAFTPHGITFLFGYAHIPEDWGQTAHLRGWLDFKCVVGVTLELNRSFFPPSVLPFFHPSTGFSSEDLCAHESFSWVCAVRRPAPGFVSSASLRARRFRLFRFSLYPGPPTLTNTPVYSALVKKKLPR